jgi:starch-binding outer membrane protein, SusD/RagB family
MKRVYILIITGFVFTFSGCVKNVLDKKDLTAVNEQETWNNIIFATGYLDKCYLDNMPVWDGSTASYSDESTGGGNFLYGQLQIEGESGPSAEYWPYDAIYKLNILINNIDNGKLSEKEKNIIKGQALFLRAFRYFEMVKRYGGVPLVLKPQDKNNDDLYVKRNKTSECITQIVADLDQAAGWLPGTWSGNDVGRISKGAAMAFKGRVLMYYASKQFNRNNDATRWLAAYTANADAKAELDRNGYGLNASFRDIWAKVTKETIITTRFKYPARSHTFEASIRPLDFSQGATGQHHPSLDMVESFPMKDGTAPGVIIGGIKQSFNVTATDTTGLFWINRDPRFYETIVYNGVVFPLAGNPWPQGRQFLYKGFEATQSPSKTGFYSRKFIQTQKTAIECYNGDLDWIEMRYAEVILNLAECAAETGKDAEAYTILKDIRKRAGITANGDGLYGLKSGMSGQELVLAVLFEKKLELAFESKRFWDLRRRMMFDDLPYKGLKRRRLQIDRLAPYSGMTNQVFVPQASDDKLLNSISYFNYFKTTIFNIDDQYAWNVPANYYFFALPKKHFEQNPNLEQTKGWNNGTFDPLL